MQFSSSLKLNHIFRRLYRKGNSAANGYLVLYCRKNGSQANRVGLTVSAKLAHAVQRNRLRRQLREIYRLHEASFNRGYDLVVVARTRAIGADYAALEHAYLHLPQGSACCRRTRREARFSASHPPVSEAYLPGPSAPVPVFTDLLAVCARGDHEIRGGKGRLAGAEAAAAVQSLL